MPIGKSVKIGKDVKIPYPRLVNLFGCVLGDRVFVGPFVEIQKGVVIGKNTRISSHSFICEGVSLGRSVFVAHSVVFINDLFDSENIKSWKLKRTIVEDGVRIGSNATILPCVVGKGSIIGAGAVVTRDVPQGVVVAGNPAKVLRKIKNDK